jgi:hypothetical protein
VSYRESSVEDNDRDSDFTSSNHEANPSSLSRRQISLRARQPQPNPGRRHSTRESTRLKPSLKDPSSDEDFSSESQSDDGINGELVALEPLPKRRRTSCPVASRTRQANSTRHAQVRTRRPPRKHTALAMRAPKSKRILSKKWIQMETDGVYPSWVTLPYHILVSIFDFAYAQQAQDSVRGNASAWLLHATQTCVAFCEPALAALHRRPDLCSSRRIVSFAEHMSQPPETTYINYRSKVKHLAIDERHMPIGFAFIDFLRNLPQLAHVDIFSSKDTSLRGHPAIDTERYWKYPRELVPFLNTNLVSLISWHWNWKIMDMTANSIPISNVMPGPILQNLKEVKFTNFPEFETLKDGKIIVFPDLQVDESLDSAADDLGK